MDNYFYTASILSFIFFILKFIEMRFITKSNKSLKELSYRYNLCIFYRNNWIIYN